MSVECIQDEESRLFLTTIGSWEGSIEWTDLAWASEGGAGKIIVPANGGTVTVQLAWPAIIVGVTAPPYDVATVNAAAAVGFDPPATELTMQVEITDGNYSYEGFSYTSYSPEHWESPAAMGDIEYDWSVEGTTLKVHLSNPTDTQVTAYIDSANFFEEYPPEPPVTHKMQYLPVTGMG